MKFAFRLIEGSELPTIKNAKLADAQAIGEALTAIDKNLGAITPRTVVDAARDVSSVLHPHFEWDDGVAAEQHRLAQARGLVRCITVEPSKRSASVGDRPAFLSVKSVDGDSRAYRPLDVVLSSRELQDQVLASAERDLLAWENRYQSLTGIIETVRKAREQVTIRRQQMANSQAAA